MDPLKQWQAEAILSRHRDPIRGLHVIAVLAAVGIALSPLILGIALCLGLVSP